MSVRLGSHRWHKQFDRAVRQAAAEVSAVIDKMIENLPEGAAPQNAIEGVVIELAEKQKHIRHTWLLSLIMEDPDIRESYEAALACRVLLLVDARSGRRLTGPPNVRQTQTT